MKKITIESRSTTSGKRQDTHNQNELQGLVVAVRSKQTRIALACICVLVVGAAITSLVVLLKDMCDTIDGMKGHTIMIRQSQHIEDDEQH
jgi:hypothetical protein